MNLIHNKIKNDLDTGPVDLDLLQGDRAMTGELGADGDFDPSNVGLFFLLIETKLTKFKGSLH